MAPAEAFLALDGCSCHRPSSPAPEPIQRLELCFATPGELVQCFGESQLPLVQIIGAQFAWNRESLAVEIQTAGERKRDLQAVPAVQKLFFFATNATGTIGAPDSCAATMTPG